MAIDMRDLPLGLGSRGEGEGFAAGGSKLALARRRVVDAWLDDDPAGLAGAIDQAERDLGPDLDGLASFRSSIIALADDFRARRQLARSGAERDEARSGLAATLGRLSQSVAASDDPTRRDLLGREARGLIETHRAEGLLDPEDAEALAVEYDRGLGQAQAARIAREDPALARQLLRDESLFPGLDPETRERYAKAAEARLAAREEPDDGSAAELAAGVTARARAGADLMRRLKTDRLTEGDVAAAESLGEIDAATARRLRRELDATREAGRRAVEDLSRAESAFAEGRKLNPKDPLDRGAIDRHYELIRKGWEESGLSPEEVRPAIADYIAEIGVIPSEVERKLPFYLDNGTREEKWEAADLIQLLVERDFDPQEIPIEYRRKALGIAELVRKGYEPTQAVELDEIGSADSGQPAVEGELQRFNSLGQSVGPRSNSASTTRPAPAEGAKQRRVSDPDLDALISLLEEAFRSAASASGNGDVESEVLPPSSYRVTPTLGQQPSAPSPSAPIPPPTSRTPRPTPKITPKLRLPGLAGVAAAIVAVVESILQDRGEPETIPADTNPSAEPAQDQAPAGRAPEDQPPMGAPPAPANVPPTQEPAPKTNGGIKKGPPSFGEALEQSVLERWSEIEARRAVSPDTIPGKKYGIRGDPETQEEVRVIAEACKEVAETEFPDVKYEHYAGGTKDGIPIEEGGKSLPEQRVYTSPEGDSYKLPDVSSLINDEPGHINNADRYKSGNITKRERDNAKSIDELADETIAIVGKRDQDESWDQYKERAKDGCREMISGAKDRGIRKALDKLRQQSEEKRAKESVPENKSKKGKAKGEADGR